LKQSLPSLLWKLPASVESADRVLAAVLRDGGAGKLVS
jgi:hypothetical protein